jgi:hydrogenase maturation protease
MTSNRTDRQPSTLILGLGNTLMTDEAAGIAVLHRLEAEGRLSDAILLDGGTLSFTLAGHIADCPRLIVIDAAVMGTAPGTVRVFEGRAMDRQLSGRGKSVHEVGLMELMDMARLTDTLPDRRALVGIEPALVDWGDCLTGAVSEAIPRATTAVYALLEAWDSASQQAG